MKIIRNGQGFELVDLTEEDRERILKELREKNARIMERCLLDADSLAASVLGRNNYRNDTVALIAGQLFDKLATKLFSEEQRLLTQKVHWKKEESSAVKQVAARQCEQAVVAGE